MYWKILHHVTERRNNFLVLCVWLKTALPDSSIIIRATSTMLFSRMCFHFLFEQRRKRISDEQIFEFRIRHEFGRFVHRYLLFTRSIIDQVVRSNNIPQNARGPKHHPGGCRKGLFLQKSSPPF
jgi:hypothetical protein